MATILKTYFPTIRTRKEVLEEISESEKLSEMFRQWNEGQQEEFLDVCTETRLFVYMYTFRLTYFGILCTIKVSETSWKHGSNFSVQTARRRLQN